MSGEHTNPPYAEFDVNSVIAWTIATPVLFLWALLSFMPVFSLFGLSRSALTITADILFFGAGFYGLVAVYIFAQVTSSSQQARDMIVNNVRGNGLKLAAYAAVWLFLYAAYRFAV